MPERSTAPRPPRAIRPATEGARSAHIHRSPLPSSFSRDSVAVIRTDRRENGDRAWRPGVRPPGSRRSATEGAEAAR